MTQQEIVLQHIQLYGYITNAEASDIYKIMQLQSTIYNIRRKYGVDFVESVLVKNKNKHYTKYIMGV